MNKKRMINKRGGVDEFKGLIFGFILLTLFSFLAITFVVDVSENNGKDTSELSEGAFSLEPYEEFLGDVDSRSDTFRERFESGNIFSIIVGVVAEGIFSVGKDMVVLITTPFTLLAQILTNVLGVPSIVTSVILGVIILSIIFGLWRLIKIGD